MEALEKNGTLDVVELPKEKSLVGCKWVFIVKYKAGGSLESYKVRLVGKGYTQTYGSRQTSTLHITQYNMIEPSMRK